MNIIADIWDNPDAYLITKQPDHPVHFFAPSKLHARAKLFQSGFPGLVTFAVKANSEPAVISNLVAAGINAFDVASPNEIRLISTAAPDATMHYNNPIRSNREVKFAVEMGVRSYSVDRMHEFEKLQKHMAPDGIEISVRFKLPSQGAAYDFGSKFGATPELAVEILRNVAAKGFLPSITFHPGTQCEEPSAWVNYIIEAGKIAKAAGVQIHRLNVGGGFPADMDSKSHDLNKYFKTISDTVAKAFPDKQPKMVCEPGRAMVASSSAHVTRIKSIGDDGSVFLNDGIYGGLSEFPILDIARSYRVISTSGIARTGQVQNQTIFGPTCDSVDTLPKHLTLPADIKEDDYVIFQNMGAYVHGIITDFNGYGQLENINVITL